MKALIDQLSEAAAEANFETDDYYVDGIRHCSKCKDAKEMMLKVPIGEGEEAEVVKVSKTCKCKAEEHKRNRELIKEQQREMRRERIRQIGMRTSERLTATFEADREPDSTPSRIMRGYAKNFEQMLEDNHGVALYGAIGTGKSYYAYCVANYLIDRNYSVYAISVPELMQMSQGYDQSKTQEAKDYIARAHLVIMDDVGAERDTSYASEQLYDLVNIRYESNRPTIITTNYNLEKFKPQGDLAKARIYDRLQAMCDISVLVDRKTSWREQIRREKMSQALGSLAASGELGGGA